MKTLNILIVEDEVLTAADIRQTLEKAGHRVTAVARNFQEAVAAAKTLPPDLLLLDIQLRGSEDGIAVAKEILLAQQFPIIVLTASTEDETYLRAKQTFTPAAYITKPFRQLDLIRHVDLAWHNFASNINKDVGAVTSDNIFLPVEGGFEKVSKSDVTHITTQKSMHRVNIFEVYKKEPRLIHLSMGHLEQYFNPPNFYRLSRSLLVNLNFIERIEGSTLKLESSGTLLTIPEAARTDLMKRLAIARISRR